MTTESGLRRPAARWAVVLVTLACCLTLLFGWWVKARCLPGGWQDGEQYLQWCYTDVYPLWFAERLNEGAVPYLDHPVEYPVLTGAQMHVAALLVRLVPGPPGANFFHLTAAMGAAMCLAVLGLLRDMGLPPRRLLWWAAVPTLAAYAFMNWDPLAVLLMVAAVALHRQGRDAAAGLAAGFGAAAKLFPGLVVPVVVATRLAQGRRRDALVHAGAAAGAWLVVNVPVLVVAPEGWRRFLDLNRARPADWDSLWLLAQRVLGAQWSTSAVNAASLAIFLAGAALIAVVGGRRRPPERWWELLLPLLVWFLLANKVYSPQFSLWLLPLMALALPSAPAFAAFAVADLWVFLVRFPYLGGVGGLEPAPGYDLFAAALLIRAVALGWVLVASVRGGPTWSAWEPAPERPATTPATATGSANS